MPRLTDVLPAELLRPHVPAIMARAAGLDAAAAFPVEDVAVLRALGLPAVPLPRSHGGAGAGTEPEGAAAIFGLLRLLGQANPSLGRLYEAHVNVLRLVTAYAAPVQRAAVAEACHAGALYGLWVTDAPGRALHDVQGRLVGAKGPGSGAGHLRHALVTIDDGTALALVALSGDEPVEPLGPRLHGMRASANGIIALDGAVPMRFGASGDYLREPLFSTGAWRTMAVTLGALDALVDATAAQLRARGHHEAPLQQARFGEMLIARETASLWTERAGLRAEAGLEPAADVVAYVGLARIATEAACFDAMRHAQRALGLPALVRPNPVERLLRDLATYLRQPAADAVLTEAAAHVLR